MNISLPTKDEEMIQATGTVFCDESKKVNNIPDTARDNKGCALLIHRCLFASIFIAFSARLSQHTVSFFLNLKQDIPLSL